MNPNQTRKARILANLLRLCDKTGRCAATLLHKQGCLTRYLTANELRTGQYPSDAILSTRRDLVQHLDHLLPRRP